MRKVEILRKDGYKDIVTAYENSDFPLYELNESLLKCHTTKGVETYIKSFCTFDIETTTIKQGDTAQGFMYHWQMTAGGIACYGRDWLSWVDFMKKLIAWHDVTYENRLVIYVFNLGFEFQFMRNFLDLYFGGFEIFAAARRQPLRIVTKTGLEFRCAYKLTNMTLAKAVENEKGVVHVKAKGDLDYRRIRTSKTPLDNTEFGYCISDVVSLHELILNKLKNENDTLESIPMTSTGYVRRDVRNSCRADKKYREKVFKKCRIDKDVYTLLKEAARGGNTHANRYMSGRIWHDVDSYDVASSYPAQMLLQKFPMTGFTYYGECTIKEFNKLLKTKACLFRVLFYNLRVKPAVTMPYLPIDKARDLIKADMIADNGRIVYAEAATFTLTDIDFEIVKSQYTFDDDLLVVSDVYTADYGYLPECITNVVMEYFHAKTRLKGDIKKAATPEQKADLNYLYMKSKNKLNGIFGMCYTDPVHELIELGENMKWKVSKPDIAKALEKYYSSRNSFLCYAWGVWVTAHARKWLETLINATGNGTIYCDTDSSKAVNVDKSAIDKLNEQIKAMCIDRNAYSDYDGKRYYLGLYELETDDGVYNEFITLGAKKYAYTDADGLHITVSGVEKKKGAAELQDIKNFRAGFIFKDAGGLELVYNDEKTTKYIEIDGCKMLTASNIAMLDSTYTLGLTEEYAELIGYNVYEWE